MCLITKQSEPTILTEDLIVYKLFLHKHDLIKSAYFNFVWKPGKLYKTQIEISTSMSFYDNIAFHNALTNKELVDYNSISHESCLVKYNFFKSRNFISYGPGFHSMETPLRSNNRYDYYECTIPAGSEIYKDNSGLIISNQLIVNKVYNTNN